MPLYVQSCLRGRSKRTDAFAVIKQAGKDSLWDLFDKVLASSHHIAGWSLHSRSVDALDRTHIGLRLIIAPVAAIGS